MRNHFHLTYKGADGVIYSQLQRGHAISGRSVNLLADDGLARIHERSLPNGSADPPPLIWLAGLKLLLPGTTFDFTSREILIPLEQLLVPFWHHGPSQLAVGDLLDQVRVAGKTPALLRALPLFPKSPSVGPTWIEAWIARRDQAWQVIKNRKGAPPGAIPDLNWGFLDVIVLAYWEKIKTHGRRESFHYAVISAIAETSENEAEFVGQFDVRVPADGGNSRFYRYLKERRFLGFARGALSAQEAREIYGAG